MSLFIFIRHGKSYDNKNGIVSTSETMLTPEGKTQARKAGRSLKNRGVATIVCSPYARAQETAAIIAAEIGYNKADIQVLDQLRERYLGDFEGKPHEHEREWYFTVDGVANVESVQNVMQRTLEAVQRIEQLSKDGLVLVVGHTMAGYYLAQVAAGKRNLALFDAPKVLPNTQPIDMDLIAPSRMQTMGITRKHIVALGVSCMLLAVTLALWVIWPPAANPQQVQTGTQSQSIPMSADDFNESPALQGAVKQQLEPQQSSQLQPSGINNLQQTVPGLQGSQ